jgi:hypothetical protein
MTLKFIHVLIYVLWNFITDRIIQNFQALFVNILHSYSGLYTNFYSQ